MRSSSSPTKHLKNIPLFSTCSAKELAMIAKSTDEITVDAGKVIVDQGQMGREAFVLISGEAVARRNGKKVASFSRGAVIGELSLLDHGPRTASVVAQSDCRLLVISQRNLYSVIEKVPSISRKLMATLAARIREMDRAYYG